MYSLQQWEDTLRKQVAGGNVLLGQLPIGQSPYNERHMRQLGRLLATQFKKGRSVYRCLEAIEDQTPLTFALFLVLHGVYSYEQGEYWPHPIRELQIPYDANITSECGRTFRRILSAYRLPAFAHIEGLQNLVPILAHGGIPNYSLGDFFRLLHTSIEGSLIQLDAETLIEEWGQDLEQSFFSIDKPVERFVLHGGAVAADFVEECIALVTARDPASVAGLELPRRVIDAYEDWRDRDAATQLSGPRIRLQRPVLFIDPYGEGVGIELPPPFYPLGRGVEFLRWEIEAGDRQVEVATYRQRVADGYEYEALQEVQVPVASYYRVTLSGPEELVREWKLLGLNDGHLLMFDPDTWKALGHDEYGRPGERWLLYPTDGRLTVDGGQLTRHLSPQYGDRGQYCAEEWIIPAGSILRLSVPGRDLYQLEISNELDLRRPRLVGGKNPLSHNVNPRFPLYSGEPPNLRIDFAQRPDADQLTRWYISIRPEGNAQPREPLSYSLNDLTDCLTYENDGSVLLELKAPKLLGSRPMGKFEIHARGPFGQSRRLGLRIVPHLTVIGDKQLYLERPTVDAQLRITCERDSRLQLQSDEEGIVCAATSVAPNYYEVRAPSRVHTLNFNLEGKSDVSVPFSIRLRRLRWVLVEGLDRENLAWQTRSMTVYPDTLEDPYNTEFYVDLPPFFEDEKLYGGWRLIDSSDNIRAQRPPDEERSRRQYTIPIAELMSEYREAKARGETLSLQIWIRHVIHQTDEYFVDALFLFPTFELGEISSVWRQKGDDVHLGLEWQRPIPGKNRVLFLWPADKPWVERPRERPIPDDCVEGCSLFIPNVFGTSDYFGDYLAAIEVKSPWSSQFPERPGRDKPNAFLISPGDADTYYEMLQEAVDDGCATADELLVLFHHYYRTGAIDEMHTINRMLRSAAQQGQLQVEHLVLWAEITQAVDRTAYKLAQRYSLFTPETIEKLEKRRGADGWRKRYFAHLPADFNNQREVYEYLLVAEFPEAYETSLQGLCRLGDIMGVEHLLSDVEDGRLLLRKAVEWLLPAAEKVMPYLAEKGTDDALTLLHLLAERSSTAINWLQPGFFVKTDIGAGQVQRLIAADSGQPVASCGLNDLVYAHVVGNPPIENLPFIIDLSAPKAIIDVEVYQCAECQMLFETHDLVVSHHTTHHPTKSPHFRHLNEPGTEIAVGFLTVESEKAEVKER